MLVAPPYPRPPHADAVMPGEIELRAIVRTGRTEAGFMDGRRRGSMRAYLSLTAGAVLLDTVADKERRARWRWRGHGATLCRRPKTSPLAAWSSGAWRRRLQSKAGYCTHRAGWLAPE